MSAPLVISATVTTPPVEGAADSPFPLAFTGSYDHLIKYRYTLTGTGTKAVDFGSLATGAKVVIVSVDSDSSPSAQPVNLVFNGGSDQVEVSQGGFLLFGSPVPTASGITDLSITYASSVKMYVWIFG